MIEVQSVRATWLASASFTNGATAALLVDTQANGQRSEYTTFLIQLGTEGTTNPPTVFGVYTSDTTVVTTFQLISTPLGSASFTSAYTAGNTAAADNFMIGIQSMSADRYLRLEISPATTSVISAVAIGSRLSTTPINNADYGTAVAPIFL